MREVVLDTETTGLSPKEGHRIIEIGALELDHHVPTGRQLHLYINPEREIDEGAMAVHGISNEFLAAKPVFAEIVDEFICFIADDPLVIHNAPFDMSFINSELKRLDRNEIPMNQTIDTLVMARKQFPGAQANLDALCKRFEINNSHRNLHGALVDADLLSNVYIELLGGKQSKLFLEKDGVDSGEVPTIELEKSSRVAVKRKIRPVRPHKPTEVELEEHRKFIGTLTKPIWNQ